MKGISFLQSIRRKRQKLEEMKRRYREEENARQYLHGTDYGRARVSGGRHAINFLNAGNKNGLPWRNGRPFFRGLLFTKKRATPIIAWGARTGQ